ncbi:hypothetical protein K439DRAFT_1021204 [Ramaria rubella]|nr:hypothetical protein K439DRAFT_1021204 [Ramaria rubella]
MTSRLSRRLSRRLARRKCLTSPPTVARTFARVSLNVQLMTSMHLKLWWETGLKTSIYLRTRAAAQTIQLTIDRSFLKNKTELTDVLSLTFTTTKSAEAEPSIVKAEPITTSLKGNGYTDGTLCHHHRGHEHIPTYFRRLPPLRHPCSTHTAKAAEEDPEFAAALQRH